MKRKPRRTSGEDARKLEAVIAEGEYALRQVQDALNADLANGELLKEWDTLDEMVRIAKQRLISMRIAA